MAQQVRQTRMFAAEDYTTVYESYVNANFQAYDFDTIRTSMVDYIRNNYPESYNNWVESAEFVALLDVIALFGHNLAYRVDLNSRNNFLSTAERQDSILKLAEFLGYQPRRNLTAFGELKVTAIKTNETVIGSSGTSLAGQEVRYENTSTVDNLDNFITLMNAIFASSNKFGSPRQQAVINGVLTQFYNLKNTEDQITFSISGIAEGNNVEFDAIGVDYNSTQKTIIENTPDPQGAFSIIYKDDGKGVQSSGTGFFVGFKQGAISYQDFVIENAVSSQTLDISAENVNNTDVWVQTIDTLGNIEKNWTKVESVNGQNAIYNTIENGVKDIYAVKTRENNQVSIQFADSRFGNLPRGIIRAWYRQSENSTYTLRPDDIGTKKINMDYVGIDGNTYQANITVQLKQNVTNASASESMDDIKANAPRIYATQDRMITAQDYNSYLLKQSDDIAKIKSINRTHSGHSRYIDFNDPTGMYTKVRMYATDGLLAKQNRNKQAFTSGITEENVYKRYIKSLLADDELVNLYYDGFKLTFENLAVAGSTGTVTTPSADALTGYTFTWQTPASDTTADTSTGWFVEKTDTSIPVRVGSSTTTYLKYLTPGSLIKFNIADSVGTLTGTYKWAKVSTVFASGLGVDNSQGSPSGRTSNNDGAISLDTFITTNSQIEIIYPAFARQFSSGEKTNIINFLKSKQTFALKYDYMNIAWDVIERRPQPTASNADYPYPFTYNEYDNGLDNNWLIHIDYSSDAGSDKWTVTTRTLRYSLTSNQIEFSNLTNEFQLDEDSKKKRRDTIDLQKLLPQYTTGTFYVYGYEFVEGNVAYGLYNPNKVILSLVDNNADARPDDPEGFINIVETGSITNITSSGTTLNITATNSLNVGDKVSISGVIPTTLNISSATVTAASSTEFSIASTITDSYVSGGEFVPHSENDLRFEWTHIPATNEIVDPSFTNIIDVFVLTRNYDTLYRSWLGDQRDDLSEPYPPTLAELNQSFNQNISKKAMSDSIIYRPIKYKVIFGSKSLDQFRSRFRIIKVPGVKLTDNEIKNRVVTAINEFFDIANWDFGETFYFTELAAYIHKELLGVISSFVIVPEGASSVFGDLFQITPMSDELFIPDISVSDIDIIENITQENIRAS